MSGLAQPSLPIEGGALDADFGVWPLFGWGLLLVISTVLVVPMPWVMTSFYRWAAVHMRVPQRPNLAFTGQPGDIWWVLIPIALGSYAEVAHVRGLPLLMIPIQAALSWLVIRWVISHLSSEGQPLPLKFAGSVWGYIGWQVLLYVLFITIIGWAWVTTAWLRWMCRISRHAPRGFLQRQWMAGVVADAGLRRDRHFHHPDPVDDALVRALVCVAILWVRRRRDGVFAALRRFEYDQFQEGSGGLGRCLFLSKTSD